MAEDVDYFIPPEIGQPGVLANDLTPLPANACDAFIHAYVPDGGLVWDPFCRSDAVARAAARQGKRALLSDVNPLVTFVTRASLQTVSPRLFERARDAVAAAPAAGATLEHHINSLYATSCSHCGKPQIARSFIWSQEQGVLVDKEFFCPTCGQERQQAVDDTDRALLRRIEPRGRAYWTVLDRLGAAEGLLRSLAERLLGLYTPRALYAISTIQERIDAVVTDRDAREVLMLALLETMAQSIKLCCDDRGQRLRVGLQRLTASGRLATPLPDTFVENNVWTVFSAACQAQHKRLEQDGGLVWGRLALAGGKATGGDAAGEIASYAVRQGPASRLAGDVAAGSVDLILCMPPAIDWGDMLPLSYLWTGWLLGRDDARLFSPDQLVRPRRSNDWLWFFGAMERSLRALTVTLSAAGKLVVCLNITRLGYLNVIVLAAAAAGLLLENVAYQPLESDGLRPPALGALPGYCYLRFARHTAEPTAVHWSPDGLMESARREAAAAAIDVLRKRGEPSAYVWLHLAMLLHLSHSGILALLAAAGGDGAPAWDRLRQAQNGIEQALGKDVEFLPAAAERETAPALEADGDESSAPALVEQHGWWWLSADEQAALPLAERVEAAVYAALRQTPMPSAQVVNKLIYSLFPGLLTPEPGLVEECINSYAILTPPESWRLRPFDEPGHHERAHGEMAALLVDLGQRLGFTVWARPDLPPDVARMLSPSERRAPIEDLLPGASERDRLPDVVWRGNERTTYLFEIATTAMLTATILRDPGSGGVVRFLVVPAERARLIHLRMRSPLLRRRFSGGNCLFLRFDVVRSLAHMDSPAEQDLVENAGLKHTVENEGLQLALL